jgi:predicted RNase H-like HicB family nuclease
MRLRLVAVCAQVPEGCIGYVEESPAANAQAGALEEARARLQEAVELVLDANRELYEERLNRRVVTREPLRITS